MSIRFTKLVLMAFFACPCLISCEKDVFSTYSVKIYYEQDGEGVSYEVKRSLFSLQHPPHFQMTRRADTTFFYAPIPHGVDICLVDTKNPTFPLQNVVYEFKKGPVEHIPFFYGYGKFPYPTDNVIYIDIDRGSHLDEEILDGWCSIEPHYGSSFRGVKLRFEATWQDVSTGEEHSIKNGEALFSNGQIDVNN